MKTSFRTFLVSIVVLLILAVSSVGSATPVRAAKILYVDKDMPTTQETPCNVRINDSPVEYFTIQSAVDVARPGDVVKVAGYCRENVMINADNPGVILSGGYSPSNWRTPDITGNPTVVDGGGQLYAININTVSNITVRGFYLTNASRLVMVYPATNVRIEKNFIHGTVDYLGYASGINVESIAGFTTSNVTLTNNVIWDIKNAVSDGIRVGYHQPAYVVDGITVTNNTIYDVAENGILFASANPTNNVRNIIVENNIIARAGGTGLEIDTDLSTVKADYNLVFDSPELYAGYLGGAHDVNSDPVFADPDAANFHLLSQSPAINAGDNTAVNVATDMDGSSRIFDNTVDMGAYEDQGSGCKPYSATFKSGISDDFNTTTNNPELPTPSSYFEQWIYARYPIPGVRAFDDYESDKWFGHTFSGLNVPGYFIIGAQLEVRVRNGGGNDDMVLTFVDNNTPPAGVPAYYWESRLYEGLGVNVEQTATLTLDLGALPLPNNPLLSQTNLLSPLNATGNLDLGVEDDSAVDYADLTVNYECLQNDGNYALTIVSAHGGIIREPDLPAYHYGDVVTLSAVPNVGWTFTGWTPTMIGNQIAITGNTTVIANYVQDEYTLTLNSAHGVVTKTPNQVTYHYGDVVTLSVAPDAGWFFTGWLPSLANNQVIINGNTVITASYKQLVTTLTFNSIGAQDGWIFESTETSNLGDSLNSTALTFNLGDGIADRQYRTILSFNTASLPDNASITKTILKIKKAGALIGDNDPFTWGLALKADVCKGAFGMRIALQLLDFTYTKVADCIVSAATFGNTPGAGNWYSANLALPAVLGKINKAGLTQFRLRFDRDDNDDGVADYWRFFSGDAFAIYRPQLIIQYNIP